ncbi:AraC family transcriptional regulator [Gracilinema caldarium]|uniref:Transcriptional regulator, AraC family n=1 Tax=Gracilinema caldarium (strain ATCC 51460 / DSM 7334 / H1) TaxID=744872 RepID=F8F4B1_GRAC1|nr:AraC family transcriptional regulator [Gracilinema caldarium]AEJ20558.1 transcriptional regulator, AraC family [Gracilinema caldarium DSM 7334]
MLQTDIRIEDTVCNLRFIRKSRATTNPERHFHNSWELLYVVSGSRTFFHQHATYRMNEGSLALIPPGVLHRGINRGSETCELYNLYIIDPHHPLFMPLVPLYTCWAQHYKPVIQFEEKTRYEIEVLLNTIGAELEKKDRWYMETVWAYMTILISRVCRYAEQEKGIMVYHSTDFRIDTIMEWIQEHFTEMIDLDRVARIVALSPAYVSKLFYKETQIHLHEYLSYVRIQRACQLLATTRKPIYLIAEHCGFGSLTQFGRVFRELTGQHPFEYRKKTNPHYIG